ncbi:MAG TPA: hypothetical protein VHY48_03660 [Acidobacteriaceae bacterium]|nr:hypothetical protein [Acidobacteriaceae bacterium]
MKNHRFAAQLFAGIFLAAFTLTLTACYQIYHVPEYNFAGRPIPPSQMLERVLATYTNGGSTGGAEILDGLRDLRSNVQDTKPVFIIAGLSASNPTTILNFPEETTGYVLSQSGGSLAVVNYSTEASSGAAAGTTSFPPSPSSVAAAPDGAVFVSASEATGQIYVDAGGGVFALNLPNVDRVAVNQGVTAILAMVRNSNSLYRVIQLPASGAPVVPPGAVDCEPLLLPVFCVVPVPGTYDRPTNASWSTDGNSVYVLNCGPECGGTTAGVTVLQEGALEIDNIPTVNPLDPAAPSPLANIGVPNPIPIPGGATVSLSNGSTLYVAGQSLYSLNSSGVLGSTPRTDGLFTGYLTAINLSNYTASQPLSISDGTHTKLLFADDNTLWAGSQHCANGERAAIAAQELAASGTTDQAGNYNCLTMVTLGSTPTAQIIPAVTQSSDPSSAVTVSYPNTNQNLYYYGDLTGICWVQNMHKVFTAYGGQIHAFYTGGTITHQSDPAVGTTPAAGSELNNANFTIQGTVNDVAYMDALTNSAN